MLTTKIFQRSVQARFDQYGYINSRPITEVKLGRARLVLGWEANLCKSVPIKFKKLRLAEFFPGNKFYKCPIIETELTNNASVNGNNTQSSQ